MKKTHWFDEGRGFAYDEVRSHPGIVFMGLCFVIGVIVVFGIW